VYVDQDQYIVCTYYVEKHNEVHEKCVCYQAIYYDKVIETLIIDSNFLFPFECVSNVFNESYHDISF